MAWRRLEQGTEMKWKERLLGVVRDLKRSTKATGLGRVLTAARRKTSPSTAYWETYKKDPIVGGGVNMITFRIIGEGAVVKSEDQDTADALSKLLRDIFPYKNQLTLIRDTLVFGDGWAEIVSLAGGGVHEISPRNPEDFTIGKDDEYIYFDGNEHVAIDEKNFVHLQLFEDAESIGKGMSLVQFIKQASDDRRQIYSDIVKAIKRHGTPKYHVKVSPDDSNRYPDDEQMLAIANDFRDINSRTELVTTDQFEVKTVDTGGVPSVRDYQEFLMNEISTGMLIPLEALGMGMKGVTYATASARLREVFRYTIRGYRTIISDELTHQLIPVIAPGNDEVEISFEGLFDEDIADTVAWLEKLMPQSDPTLIFSADEIRDLLGFGNREDTEEPAPSQPEAEAGTGTEQVSESTKTDEDEAFEKFQRGFEKAKLNIKKEVFQTIDAGGL